MAYRSSIVKVKGADDGEFKSIDVKEQQGRRTSVP